MAIVDIIAIDASDVRCFFGTLSHFSNSSSLSYVHLRLSLISLVVASYVDLSTMSS